MFKKISSATHEVYFLGIGNVVHDIKKTKGIKRKTNKKLLIIMSSWTRIMMASWIVNTCLTVQTENVNSRVKQEVICNVGRVERARFHTNMKKTLVTT